MTSISSWFLYTWFCLVSTEELTHDHSVWVKDLLRSYHRVELVNIISMIYWRFSVCLCLLPKEKYLWPLENASVFIILEKLNKRCISIMKAFTSLQVFSSPCGSFCERWCFLSLSHTHKQIYVYVFVCIKRVRCLKSSFRHGAIWNECIKKITPISHIECCIHSLIYNAYRTEVTEVIYCKTTYSTEEHN